jgi:thiamine-phosphate diphosphorylase/hydroxyethylthiazole kinase
MPLDLSLYLVTDSKLVPQGKTLVEIVKEAVASGVTVVQLREKSIDTKDFVALATEVLNVTKAVTIG